jgi:hypothetical protein
MAPGAAADSASSATAAAAAEAAQPQQFPVDDWQQIVRGSPAEHIGALYDRGTETTSPVYDVHADADGVYWGQMLGKLFRGSPDGRTSPEQIGQWHRKYPAGFGITSDETHVYWLDKLEIYRRPKAGGETETITLELEANGFSVTDRYIYAAVWGCPLIYRIDKATLAIESQSIVLDKPGSGPTTVLEDAGEVFCGSWSSVYVIRQWGQEAERLTNVAEHVEGMAVVDGHVYWLDRHSTGSPTIGRVPRAGGESEVFVFSDLFISPGVTRLLRESMGKTLWYSDGRYLLSFETATGRYAVRAFDGPIDIAISDGYIYWTAQFGINGVKRMPLDAPLLYQIR